MFFALASRVPDKVTLTGPFSPQDAASEYVEMVTASNKDREAVEEHNEDDSDDEEEEEMRFVDR
jgi:hypothetical protein